MSIISMTVVAILIILSFIAGIRLDNYYQTKAAADKKDALERQFVRLRAGADFDDPCKPYVSRYIPPAPVNVPYNPAPPHRYVAVGCTDAEGNPTVRPYDLIDKKFMDDLKTTGRAKTSFRKSDLTK